MTARQQDITDSQLNSDTEHLAKLNCKRFMSEQKTDKQFKRKLRTNLGTKNQGADPQAVTYGGSNGRFMESNPGNDSDATGITRQYSGPQREDARLSENAETRKRFINTASNPVQIRDEHYDDNIDSETEVFYQADADDFQLHSGNLSQQQAVFEQLANHHREIDLVLQSNFDDTTKQRMIQDIQTKFRNAREMQHQNGRHTDLGGSVRVQTKAGNAKYQTHFTSLNQPLEMAGSQQYLHQHPVKPVMNQRNAKIRPELRTKVKHVRNSSNHDKYLLPEVHALATEQKVNSQLQMQKSELSQNKKRSQGSLHSAGRSPKFQPPHLFTKRTFGNIYCGYCHKDELSHPHGAHAQGSGVLRRQNTEDRRKKFADTTIHSKSRQKKYVSPPKSIEPLKEKVLFTPGKIRSSQRFKKGQPGGLQAPGPRTMTSTGINQPHDHVRIENNVSIFEKPTESGLGQSDQYNLVERRIKKQKSTPPPREATVSGDENLTWEEYLAKQQQKFRRLYGKKLVVEDDFKRSSPSPRDPRRSSNSGQHRASNQNLNRNSPLLIRGSSPQSRKFVSGKGDSSYYSGNQNTDSHRAKRKGNDHSPVRGVHYSSEMAQMPQKDRYHGEHLPAIGLQSSGAVRNSQKFKTDGLYQDSKNSHRTQQPDPSSIYGGGQNQSNNTGNGAKTDNSRAYAAAHPQQSAQFKSQDSTVNVGRLPNQILSDNNDNSMVQLTEPPGMGASDIDNSKLDASRIDTIDGANTTNTGPARYHHQGFTHKDQTPHVMTPRTNLAVAPDHFKIDSHHIQADGRPDTGPDHRTSHSMGKHGKKKVYADGRSKSSAMKPSKDNSSSIDNVLTNNSLGKRSRGKIPKRDASSSVENTGGQSAGALKKRRDSSHSSPTKSLMRSVAADSNSLGRHGKSRSPLRKETTQLMEHLTYGQVKVTPKTKVLINGQEILSHQGIHGKINKVGVGFGTGRHSEARKGLVDRVMPKIPPKQSTQQQTMFILPGQYPPVTSSVGLQTKVKKKDKGIGGVLIDTKSEANSPRTQTHKSLYSVALSAKNSAKKSVRDQYDQVSNGRFNPVTFDENDQTSNLLLEQYLNRPNIHVEVCTDPVDILSMNHRPDMQSVMVQTTPQVPEQLDDEPRPLRLPQEPRSSGTGNVRRKQIRNKRSRGYNGDDDALSGSDDLRHDLGSRGQYTGYDGDGTHGDDDNVSEGSFYSNTSELETPQVEMPYVFTMPNAQEPPEDKLPEDWGYSTLYSFIEGHKGDELVRKGLIDPDSEEGKRALLAQSKEGANLSLEERLAKNLNPDGVRILSYLDCDYSQALLKKKKMKDEQQTLTNLYEAAKTTIIVLTENMVEPEVSLNIFFKHYQEINRKNVIKLLLRCKRLYDARNQMVGVLTHVMQVSAMMQPHSVLWDLLLDDSPAKVKSHVACVRRSLRFLSQALTKISTFQEEHRLFAGEFKFNDKNQVEYMTFLGEILAGYLARKRESNPSLQPNGLLQDEHDEKENQMATYRDWVKEVVKEHGKAEPPSDKQADRWLPEEATQKDFDQSRVAKALKAMPSEQQSLEMLHSREYMDQSREMTIQEQAPIQRLDSQTFKNQGKTLISDQHHERTLLAKEKRELLQSPDYREPLQQLGHQTFGVSRGFLGQSQECAKPTHIDALKQMGNDERRSHPRTQRNGTWKDGTQEKTFEPLVRHESELSSHRQANMMRSQDDLDQNSPHRLPGNEIYVDDSRIQTAEGMSRFKPGTEVNATPTATHVVSKQIADRNQLFSHQKTASQMTGMAGSDRYRRSGAPSDAEASEFTYMQAVSQRIQYDKKELPKDGETVLDGQRPNEFSEEASIRVSQASAPKSSVKGKQQSKPTSTARGKANSKSSSAAKDKSQSKTSSAAKRK